MRITEHKLRQIVREELIGESFSDDGWGSFSPENQWLTQIPTGILTTCSKDPITQARDTSADCGIDFKPRGLWYAPGKDWIEWMVYEMPEWLNATNYVYRIVPATSVLKLQTEEEVRSFNSTYGSTGGRSIGGRSINWSEVAEDYDGVEIIPYQYDLRNSNVSWYYTWDIASGCIWRPRGVSELQLIAKRPGV